MTQKGGFNGDDYKNNQESSFIKTVLHGRCTAFVPQAAFRKTKTSCVWACGKSLWLPSIGFCEAAYQNPVHWDALALRCFICTWHEGDYRIAHCLTAPACLLCLTVGGILSLSLSVFVNKRLHLVRDRGWLSLSGTVGQFYPVQRNSVCVWVMFEKDKESTSNNNTNEKKQIPCWFIVYAVSKTSTWIYRWDWTWMKYRWDEHEWVKHNFSPDL